MLVTNQKLTHKSVGGTNSNPREQKSVQAVSSGELREAGTHPDGEEVTAAPHVVQQKDSWSK